MLIFEMYVWSPANESIVLPAAGIFISLFAKHTTSERTKVFHCSRQILHLHIFTQASKWKTSPQRAFSFQTIPRRSLQYLRGESDRKRWTEHRQHLWSAPLRFSDALAVRCGAVRAVAVSSWRARIRERTRRRRRVSRRAHIQPCAQADAADPALWNCVVFASRDYQPSLRAGSQNGSNSSIVTN